jgi:hypothetical protein
MVLFYGALVKRGKKKPTRRCLRHELLEKTSRQGRKGAEDAKGREGRERFYHGCEEKIRKVWAVLVSGELPPNHPTACFLFLF